ncbi:ABC transporter permease [Streptosporangium sp. CA-115845]|uniref:ABC transporter permease n=1 Tax=Streptosporangium sp. CA-115845 TaxID=3240071 RepID=UPI003D8EAF89
MIAAFRYEFRMQIRRPVLWIVYGLTFAVTVVTLYPAYVDLQRGSDRGDPTTAMIVSADLLMTLLPIVYGCLLADRLVRDRRLGVVGVLDSTPTGHTIRLIGKYLGACAATAVPLALAYFGRAVVYAIVEGEPSAPGWATAVFVTTIVPALLFVGALALAGPLLMPPMLFQVLFVVYWFWGNLIPPRMMPTLADTVLSPNSQYVAYGLLGYRPAQQPPDVLLEPGYYTYGGPTFGGAALDFLRPMASVPVALLWIGVMLVLAVFVLSLARLHAIRTES